MPLIKLNRQQHLFLESKTKGTIYIGGLATGKSFILVLKAIQLLLEGKRGLFLSYSLNNCRDNIVPLIREVLGILNFVEGVDYSLTKSPAINLTIHNTDLMIRTASDPNVLRGPSVSFVMYEEARELTREAFDVGLGRLRKGNDLQWFLASSPRGRDWMYQLIDKEGLTDIFVDDNFHQANEHVTIVRANTRLDTPHIDPSYVLTLSRQYTSVFAMQELDARIVDMNGEIIKSEWFIKQALVKPAKGVRSWDLAVSTKTTSDYSAGALLSKTDNKYYIHDIKRVKQAYPDLKKLIIATAIQDGPGVVIGLEDAGQQAAIRDDLRRDPALSNYTIRTYRPTKDKITRALPFASQAEFSNVIVNVASWNKEFYEECSTFGSDSCIHDDQIDSVVQGYHLLNSSGPVQSFGLG